MSHLSSNVYVMGGHTDGTDHALFFIILKALPGDEGLLVASKIADQAGITRSVIVNALRKFESAGVLETESLGMKGTYVRILNEYLRDGLKEHRK